MEGVLGEYDDLQIVERDEIGTISNNDLYILLKHKDLD